MNSWSYSVEEFSSSGALLTQFGTYGTGNGQFEFPTGLAFDGSGNLWVADAYGRRLEEFQVVPEPSSAALLGAAAAGFVALAWRRRRRRS